MGRKSAAIKLSPCCASVALRASAVCACFLGVDIIERVLGVARNELDRAFDIAGHIAKHDQVAIVDALSRLLQRSVLMTSGPRDRFGVANDLE